MEQAQGWSASLMGAGASFFEGVEGAGNAVAGGITDMAGDAVDYGQGVVDQGVQMGNDAMDYGQSRGNDALEYGHGVIDEGVAMVGEGLEQGQEAAGQAVDVMRDIGEKTNEGKIPAEVAYEMWNENGIANADTDAICKIPTHDILLEEMAHNYAYGGWRYADPEVLASWGYAELDEIDDPDTGFYCIGFLALPGGPPEGPAKEALKGSTLRSVLAFRGTEPADLGDVGDDLNEEGVGSYQYTANEGKIAALLAALGGKVDVTGHSLGGALAQLAASRNASSIGRVVTFQAPGINEDDAEKLDEAGVDSTHYRSKGDWVPAGGETLTTGKITTIDMAGLDTADGHLDSPLAHANAAKRDAGDSSYLPGVAKTDQEDFSSEIVGVDSVEHSYEDEDWVDWGGEMFRTGVGMAIDGAAPISIQGNNTHGDDYARVWEDMRDKIDDGKIDVVGARALIATEQSLTDEQRDSMGEKIATYYREKAERDAGGSVPEAPTS